MKAAIEQFYNGTHDVVVRPDEPYDATKINVTSLTRQTTADGQTFIGPFPTAIAQVGQGALAIPAAFVHPVQWGPDEWWIFGGDAATAAPTRRVQLWRWIPSTNAVSFVGAVTLTYPTATSHVMRGLRAVLRRYTTGTVAVSGTSVTGTSTDWLTARIPAGSRIGFGTTDPNAVTTWYRLSATPSTATAATLTVSAGTIAAGTPYVIEELLVLTSTTNATVTNGGLFVAKGLAFEDFQNPATTISAATTADLAKAVYWLKDAATVTNTVSGGCAIDDIVSASNQSVYLVDGAATSLKVYRYNFRAAITPTSGAAVLSGGDLTVTGTQTVVGNISQLNNGRVATLGHGPGAGVACLYAMTTTRIIRMPLASITTGSTTFVADSMAEVPPGGTETSLSVATFLAFDIAGSIDRILIAGAASSGTMYLTQYDTGGAQFERRMCLLSNQTPSALRDAGLPAFPHATMTGTPIPWVENGVLFLQTSSGTTANLNACYIYPLAADWNYGTKIIAPKMTVPASARFYRVLANEVRRVGNDTHGVTPSGYRILYRTSGIDDDSGAWTTVDPDGDLSGVNASEVQFAFEFCTMSLVMLPARVLSLVLLYETQEALPSQYQWNFGDFNQTNGTFAWVQDALFGASPGVHTINIYRADTDVLVLTQASSGSTNGTFEFWNGSAWTAELGADAVGVRRRFVPTGSLPSGVDLYATLTVA